MGIGTLYKHQQWQKKTVPLKAEYVTGKITNSIKTGNPLWPYRLTFHITNSCNDGISTTTNCPIFIYTKKDTALLIDDVITLKNCTIKKPAQNDFNIYLRKEGALSTLFIPFLEIEDIKKPSFSLRQLCFRLQNFISLSAKKNLSPFAYALFSSLFLGDKGSGKQILEPLSHHFQEWGIAHQLAKSGFHLVVFIAIWHLLLNFIPLRFSLKHTLLIFLCGCYFLLTPASISFVRSFYLFLISRIMVLFGWQTHTINILSLICYVTLLFNPYLLFALDFQLSFYLTLCLSWIAQIDRQKRMIL